MPQDDLYTISREVDVNYELFQPRTDTRRDTATRLPNDDTSSVVDRYVTKNNERSSGDETQRCSAESNESGSSEDEKAEAGRTA